MSNVVENWSWRKVIVIGKGVPLLPDKLELLTGYGSGEIWGQEGKPRVGQLAASCKAPG